jgi:hypothetical protein
LPQGVSPTTTASSATGGPIACSATTRRRDKACHTRRQ